MRRELGEIKEVPKTEQELIELAGKKTSVENEINEATKTKGVINENINTLQTEHESLQEDVSTFEARRAAALKLRDEAEIDLSNFEQEAGVIKSKLNAEIIDITKRISPLLDRVQSLKLEIISLEGDKQNVIADIENHVKILGDIQYKIGEGEKRVGALGVTIGNLNQEIVRKNNDIVSLDASIDEQMQKLTAPGSTRNTYAAELERLIKEVEDRSVEVRNLISQREQIIDERDQAQAEIETFRIEMEEKNKVFGAANEKLSERIEFTKRMIEDGKAKGFLNDKFQI